MFFVQYEINIMFEERIHRGIFNQQYLFFKFSPLASVMQMLLLKYLTEKTHYSINFQSNKIEVLKLIFSSKIHFLLRINIYIKIIIILYIYFFINVP